MVTGTIKHNLNINILSAIKIMAIPVSPFFTEMLFSHCWVIELEVQRKSGQVVFAGIGHYV